MINVIGKCSFEKRNYIIFDQLNPSFAKYYKKEEIEELIKKSGFNKPNFTLIFAMQRVVQGNKQDVQLTNYEESINMLSLLNSTVFEFPNIINRDIEVIGYIIIIESNTRQNTEDKKDWQLG